MIVTLQPLFSMAGGYLIFKERFSRGAILGCFIAILGSFLVGWRDFQISNQAFYGDLLAFVAAGIITSYFFMGQHIRKNLSLVPYSIIGYASSAFFLAIYAYSQQASFAHYSLQTWLSFLGLACISTIMGQTIFNWLLKWLSASVISMSILGETIGTCILAFIILGEVISVQQGIGIALILTGLAIFLLLQRQLST